MAKYNFGSGGLHVNGIPMNANASVLGGLGCGDIKYLVETKATATNLYYKRLVKNGVAGSDIFTTLAAAYAATTSGQNDVIVVTPGTYTVTASLDWANSNTHLVGLGGPVYDGVDQYACNVLFECLTTSIAEVLKVSGNWNQFYNVGFANRYANAGNLAAVNVTSYGNYFYNVGMYGLMATTQVATVAAAALYVGNAGLSKFENCQIGQDVWSLRTGANQGVIRFTSALRPNNITFKDCVIRSTANTATCAMVALPLSTSIGRNILFDNCVFSNWYDSGASINQAFYTVTGSQKHTVCLHNCSAFGIDSWSDGGFDVVLATMPITGTGGGLHIEAAGNAGS